MIRRINRLLFILLILGISLYLVLLNRDNVTVFLVPGQPITTSAGVILIAVFCGGIVCATLVAAFFGVKAYFRERSLRNREHQRQSFFQDMVAARSFSAAEEWDKARERWQSIIRREPSGISRIASQYHIIARVELSRCLEQSGEVKEALKVLDTARSSDPQNIEVLLRAAEVHIVLGNKTAAIDNLALALYHHPVAKAAELARNLSEELGRLEDALEYHSQLEKLATLNTAASKRVLARIHLKQLLRDHASDQKVLAEKLRDFVRRQEDAPEALRKLAELERTLGNIDAAAQLLVRAARVDPALRSWRDAMHLWVSHGMPERALATARAATKEMRGVDRLKAELDLMRLYLELNMNEEAKGAIANFPQLAKECGSTVSDEMAESLLIFKALCFVRLGLERDAVEALEKVVQLDYDLSHGASLGASQNGGSAPSPVLSTP